MKDFFELREELNLREAKVDSFTHPDDHPLTSKNDRGGPGHKLNFSDKDIMRKLKRTMSDHEKKHMRGAYRDDSAIVHGKTNRTMSSIVGKTTKQVRKEVQAHIAKHHPENKIDESITDRGSHFANVAKNHDEKYKYHRSLAYDSEKDSPQQKAHKRAAHLHQTAAMTAKRVSDVHDPTHPDYHKVDDHTADYHSDAKKAKEAETIARESESEKRKNLK